MKKKLTYPVKFNIKTEKLEGFTIEPRTGTHYILRFSWGSFLRYDEVTKKCLLRWTLDVLVDKARRANTVTIIQEGNCKVCLKRWLAMRIIMAGE